MSIEMGIVNSIFFNKGGYMTNDEQENRLKQRLTLRLSHDIYEALCEKAKQHEQSVSMVVREQLTKWLQSPSGDKASYANTQAILEIVYLARVIAKACEPTSLTKARAHARKAIQKMYSLDKEVTSCD